MEEVEIQILSVWVAQDFVLGVHVFVLYYYIRYLLLFIDVQSSGETQDSALLQNR